jgi:phytoene synthase
VTDVAIASNVALTTGPAPSADVDLDVVGARAVLARHARSFRFAGLFLPADRLDVAAVVYAFCRAVDDAVDEAPTLAQAQAEARALHAELNRNSSPRPEVAAFLAVAEREGIDVRYAQELVRGVASDAAERVVVADDGELLRYCYRVAGTVGGLMCGVLGVQDPRAVPYAIDLGIGMQLTNICRDVLEDAGRNRAYLPATRLSDVGIAPAQFVDDVAHGRASPLQTAQVVRALLALADRYYASGESGMRFIPMRSRLAILIASRVYRAIGTKLLARGGDALQGRVATTVVEKLGCVLRACVAFFSPGSSVHDASLHESLRGLPGAADGGRAQDR